MALMKLCRCGKKIEYKKQMCDVCQEKYEEQQRAQSRDSNQRYDKYKRDRRSTEFYHSMEWIKAREFILNKFNYIDVYEYVEHQRIVPATTVHHIEPIKDEWSRRLDVTNMIPVSEATHNKLHGMYKYQKKNTQNKLCKAVQKYISEAKG